MAAEEIHITCPKCYADVLVETLPDVPLDESSIVNCDGCGKTLKVLKRLRIRQKAIDRAQRREEAASRRQDEARRFNEHAEVFAAAQRRRAHAEDRPRDSQPSGAASLGSSDPSADRRREQRAREAEEREREDPERLEQFFSEIVGGLAVFAFFMPFLGPIIAAVLISGSRLPRHAARRAARGVLLASALSLAIAFVLLMASLAP